MGRRSRWAGGAGGREKPVSGRSRWAGGANGEEEPVGGRNPWRGGAQWAGGAGGREKPLDRRSPDLSTIGTCSHAGPSRASLHQKTNWALRLRFFLPQIQAPLSPSCSSLAPSCPSLPHAINIIVKLLDWRI